jgi:hypothetical protein
MNIPKNSKEAQQLIGQKVKIIGNRSGINRIGQKGTIMAAYFNNSYNSTVTIITEQNINVNAFYDDIVSLNYTLIDLEKEKEEIEKKLEKINTDISFLKKHKLESIDEETIKIYKILELVDKGGDKLKIAKAIKDVL